MKKLLMAAFLLLGMVTMARAAEETQKTIVSVYMSTTATPASLAVTGAGTVYGVVLTTGTTTNYCVLRDTNTVNTTSAALLPRFYFTSSPQVLQFTTPIRFTNGLMVNNGISANQFQEECAVLYRKGKLW